MLTSDFIQNAAQNLHFDACDVVALTALPDKHQQHFASWIAHGYHAHMSYLEHHTDKRADPRKMLRNGAKTAVVVLFSYNTKQRQVLHLPQVARYAYGQDYHEVLKTKLWTLLKILQKENPNVEGRTFTDTAPLQERYWAAAAGLGWIGKNGMLINKQLGSHVFIGTLLLDAKVECAPKIVENSCGACTRCIDACPTGAILDNCSINTNKCLSYKTIEAHLHEQYSTPDIKNTSTSKYIFGCDICQSACPWNEKAMEVEHPEMQILPQLQTLTHEDWQNMTEEDFEKIFEHSPIKRATLAGMKKNLHNLLCI